MLGQQACPVGIATSIVGCHEEEQMDTLAMLTPADVPDDIIARMIGSNAAERFGLKSLEPASG
jgi:hypothetical protein